jgi:hypothetical protein
MFRDPVQFAHSRVTAEPREAVPRTRLWIAPPSISGSDCAPRQFTDGENILAKLRGGQISDAARALPSAENDANTERTVETQIPGFGLVRFVFTKQTGKRGNHGHTSGHLKRCRSVGEQRLVRQPVKN